MFNAKAAFSGFSVDDIDAARKFYTETLGLRLLDDSMGLRLGLPDGGTVFVYAKPDHEPATFTVLNLVVENIDEAVDALTVQGVSFERYDSLPAQPDQKGIVRGLAAQQGPDIAWFKDPAGNTLAVLQESLS